MQRKLTALIERYKASLKKYLRRQDPGAGLRSAQGFGRHAAAIGLETLDVAKIHERALANLEQSSRKDGLVERAELFFKEAITPIEKGHPAAVGADIRVSELDEELVRRTVDLAASNRSLKQSIVERKSIEKAVRKTGGHSRKLLQESRRLQKHLQQMTHQILRAQEGKRKKISRELQGEIAQTLLGINVRLLTARREAAVNAAGFKKEIASTQRLVDKSLKSIKRFAREFGKYHEA